HRRDAGGHAPFGGVFTATGRHHATNCSGTDRLQDHASRTGHRCRAYSGRDHSASLTTRSGAPITAKAQPDLARRSCRAPSSIDMATTDGLGGGVRVGDYILERELAAKPGLIAWSATHALLPRCARITTVQRAFAGVQTIGAELTREACILEVLRHAGVPRVFECGFLPDQRPWVASELIEAPI